MDNYLTINMGELAMHMMETLYQMCGEDAKDAAAYVYAYDRLMQSIRDSKGDDDDA